MAKTQTCAGCGKRAAKHPMVGIGRGKSGKFEKFPICFTCWADPESRKNKLKMHFYQPEVADEALAKAGNANITMG